MRCSRVRVIATGVLGVGVLVVSPPASAQEPPPGTVPCVPRVAQAGYGPAMPGAASAHITGRACTVGVEVVITLSGVEVARATSVLEGRFDADIPLPVGLPIGRYPLAALVDGQVIATGELDVWDPPAIEVNPTHARAGEELSVDGRGCGAHDPFTVFVRGVVIGQGVTSDVGRFLVTVRLPVGVVPDAPSPGRSDRAVTLIVTCGGDITMSASVEIDPPLLVPPVLPVVQPSFTG